MAEKYFAELERMWQQNRVSAPQKYFDLIDLPRAKTLRGPDFVRELIRLTVLTKDTRFQDAALALAEHRIIDRKFNFLPWEPRWRRQGRGELELLAVAAIHDLKPRCGSLRRVCAEFVARTGWPATSFVAAVKDLELLYRRRLGELEKSCCTSIPTTAAN